jgi:hypothetical protein
MSRSPHFVIYNHLIFIYKNSNKTELQFYFSFGIFFAVADLRIRKKIGADFSCEQIWKNLEKERST